MTSNTEQQRDVIAATYGGRGWQARQADLCQEIAEGGIWHCCGTQTEWQPLREVVLSWPGEELKFTEAPNEYLMLERPNLDALRRQTAALVEFYEGQGVTVHLARPSAPPPPNFLFMRDLFWATPQGVVLARPAARQRAGEERYAAEMLARLGVPMIFHAHGTATFEGADALWLDAKTVLLGVGVRTNVEGSRQLASLLWPMGITVLEVALPRGVQHLLGVVNFVDRGVAVLNVAKASPALQEVLASRGIATILLPPDDELLQGLGMNFVTLAPRRVVMPANCPGIRKKMMSAGVEVLEMDVSEYLKAAGGLACLTGILRRG
ncbi:MAG: arginine deiminase family protein [Desulfobulbaceae bacterium]|nr:arginine deiminase family protein [Desulfobulbaceae bacterium]